MKHTFLWLLTLVGCSGMQVQSGRQAGIPGTSADPDVGGTGGIPRSPGSTPGASSSQLCRNQAIPRGWVAVDYLSSSNCPPLSPNGDPGPNAMLLTRHTEFPPETVITVCADQRVPTNWSREDYEAQEGSSGRCSRKPGDTRTSPTVMRIRRLR